MEMHSHMRFPPRSNPHCKLIEESFEKIVDLVDCRRQICSVAQRHVFQHFLKRFVQIISATDSMSIITTLILDKDLRLATGLYVLQLDHNPHDGNAKGPRGIDTREYSVLSPTPPREDLRGIRRAQQPGYSYIGISQNILRRSPDKMLQLYAYKTG